MRWERRDLSADGPPPGRWRLILCRNVAIYLSPPARRRVYATLVSALSARGVLLLGRSERLLDPGALGLRPVGPARLRAARMRRRLTTRTLAVSALIVGVLAVVLGGLAIAIDRQHEGGVNGRGTRRR